MLLAGVSFEGCFAHVICAEILAKSSLATSHIRNSSTLRRTDVHNILRLGTVTLVVAVDVTVVNRKGRQRVIVQRLSPYGWQRPRIKDF